MSPAKLNIITKCNIENSSIIANDSDYHTDSAMTNLVKNLQGNPKGHQRSNSD